MASSAASAYAGSGKATRASDLFIFQNKFYHLEEQKDAEDQSEEAEEERGGERGRVWGRSYSQGSQLHHHCPLKTLQMMSPFLLQLNGKNAAV